MVEEKLILALQRNGRTDKTQEAYLKHNLNYLRFTKKSYRSTNTKSIQSYLDNEIKRKLNPKSINLIKSALKYFYSTVMGYNIGQLISPNNIKFDRPYPSLKEVN